MGCEEWASRCIEDMDAGDDNDDRELSRHCEARTARKPIASNSSIGGLKRREALLEPSSPSLPGVSHDEWVATFEASQSFGRGIRISSLREDPLQVARTPGAVSVP